MRDQIRVHRQVRFASHWIESRAVDASVITLPARWCVTQIRNGYAFTRTFANHDQALAFAVRSSELDRPALPWEAAS